MASQAGKGPKWEASDHRVLWVVVNPLKYITWGMGWDEACAAAWQSRASRAAAEGQELRGACNALETSSAYPSGAQSQGGRGGGAADPEGASAGRGRRAAFPRSPQTDRSQRLNGQPIPWLSVGEPVCERPGGPGAIVVPPPPPRSLFPCFLAPGDLQSPLRGSHKEVIFYLNPGCSKMYFPISPIYIFVPLGHSYNLL